MKITAQLTYEKVRFDEPKDLHLVVSLAAPHLDDAAPRPPVCVIPVLDVSGSMAGGKLHFAKQSVMKLVDHLAPGDFCGVVVFSTEVETLAAPAEMTQARKDELKALVGRLEARRNTNLGGGMLAGLDHAKVARLPDGMRVRVILFTCQPSRRSRMWSLGCPNRGRAAASSRSRVRSGVWSFAVLFQ